MASKADQSTLSFFASRCTPGATIRWYFWRVEIRGVTILTEQKPPSAYFTWLNGGKTRKGYPSHESDRVSGFGDIADESGVRIVFPSISS